MGEPELAARRTSALESVYTELMIINTPTARRLERQTTKSNGMSDLSCPRVARGDNSKTATEVRIWEWNESGDKWFTKTDSNCELIRVDLTTQLKTRKNRNIIQISHTFHTPHFTVSTHTHTHTQVHKLSEVDSAQLCCLEDNFNLNLQGINYIRSRSIRHSYINAAQLFRCATVITPVIILLRVYLRGPAAEWCITCRLRNHQHFHHTHTLEQRSRGAQVW